MNLNCVIHKRVLELHGINFYKAFCHILGICIPTQTHKFDKKKKKQERRFEFDLLTLWWQSRQLIPTS